VLEAMSCGLPVAAYAVKGPRDIVQHGRCGFLADDREALADRASQILADSGLRHQMRDQAIARAASYTADSILGQLLADLGLPNEDRRAPVSADVDRGYIATDLSA